MRLKVRLFLALATAGFAAAFYVMLCEANTAPGTMTDFWPGTHPVVAWVVLLLFVGLYFFIETIHPDT